MSQLRQPVIAAAKATSQTAFDGKTARRIAAAFLPGRWYGNRWHHYYARIKLATDPLYPGVVAALRGCDAPLLDVGCGAGLLLHALRCEGLAIAYRGVDNDNRKIAVAQRAAANAHLHDAIFEPLDLAVGLPPHCGSVAILDVLQYLSERAQHRTLENAVAMLTPGARLIIRTGLDDGGARARLSRRVDQSAYRLGWMNAAPNRYPQAPALAAQLQQAGLQARFTPLYGRTPFNNWLIVATR